MTLTQIQDAISSYAADSIAVDEVFCPAPVTADIPPIPGVTVHETDHDGLGHIVYLYRGAPVGRQIPTG